MERLIKMASNEGDNVLDPFCGSGTTGVAALTLNRAFTGVESNIDYIKLSIIRIQNIIK